jgi:hypothetical protein
MTGDDRPRFGLLDLFAIIAAIGIAVAGMKEVTTAARRAHSINSIRQPSPQAETPIDWNLDQAFRLLIFATPLGMLFAQPLALVLQFVPRGRRMPLTRVEWIGLTPSFLVLSAVVLRLAALSPYGALLLGPLAVLILALLLAATWVFCNRPGDRYSNGMTWTDAIGLATFWLGWPLVMFIAITIADELNR